MTDESLESRVKDLETRVRALEAVAEQVTADLGGTLHYQGTLTTPADLTWSMTLPVTRVLALPDHPHIEVLSALGHPVRASLVRVLAKDGPQSAADLQTAAEIGSTGQLYHHLKPLTTTGLVEQDGRGRYRLRPQATIPALLLLAAAADIAGQFKS
ncbi:DNA-binding transcriptional ArsR family regulator [Crossiella equi]|uniref:DNA-binding transcriptional ArsR family regulator n=1 Tax=Crossiella equi TaxID=130796 RepID=A0ABS5AC11_9PSEU|nr:helix-turn-helix domain-containing protein [Crossiella equi]MBP2473832.1 DNA-binding transcriptional ArsR family regulator [Crossiella equi]